MIVTSEMTRCAFSSRANFSHRWHLINFSHWEFVVGLYQITFYTPYPHAFKFQTSYIASLFLSDYDDCSGVLVIFSLTYRYRLVSCIKTLPQGGGVRRDRCHWEDLKRIQHCHKILVYQSQQIYKWKLYCLVLFVNLV